MDNGNVNLDATQQFSALRSHSAELGADPCQIQGAGGNTSIKQGGIMWIKASGKWLQHADQDELFVPVALAPLLEALQAGDPRAEKSTDFVVNELNPQGLRPSIETTLHAVLRQRVVIHVHCVDTISLAIQQDAQALLSARLTTFNWEFIPYVRPGLPLSRSIASRIKADTNVLVLGNHGLVVAADSVEACLALLNRVRAAVFCEIRQFQSNSVSVNKGASAAGLLTHKDLMRRIDTSDYVPALSPETHVIAFDAVGLAVAAGGSLYPDHVIFLGKGTVVAKPDEPLSAVLQRCELEDLPKPVSIVFPGEGVALIREATPGQQAMARCLSDVCLRVPANVAVNYLTDIQNHELLHWEAEQYRQALSQPESTVGEHTP
ncbi:MAG: class II aldolase/adducin family protein [Granulosicoccus sp.]